ncbi:hypothetical protein [Streptomyces chumphonensis]
MTWPTVAVRDRRRSPSNQRSGTSAPHSSAPMSRSSASSRAVSAS